MLGFRGTFSRVGKACSVSEEHFSGREKLARFPRDISPGGKTLLCFRGTFPRVGKPCSVSEGHFPEPENLAALRRNIFPSGKSLPRCAGTLSLVGKPCRAARQHFYEHENLAAFCGRVSTIICSPQSFPDRSHQGVCPCAPTVVGENQNIMILTMNESLTNRW